MSGFAFLQLFNYYLVKHSILAPFGPLLVTQLVEHKYYTSPESKDINIYIYIYIYIYYVNYCCIHTTSCTLRYMYTTFTVLYLCYTRIILVSYLLFHVKIFRKLLMLLCCTHICICTHVCIHAS